MRIAMPLIVLATAFTCSLATAPANARARVFVASYGNDANPCTFGSPCKTFQQAVNVVDAGGEVTAIDSAGFGPIIISQSVTITSPPGVEAGIVPTSGGNAITINPSSSITVTLRGLTLEGSGVGLNGIALTSTAQGTLNVIGCVVKDFTATGILIKPSFSGGSEFILNLLIADSFVLDNRTNGIEINPQSLFTAVLYDIQRTTVNGNGTSGNDAGLLFDGTAGFFRGNLSSLDVEMNLAGINFMAGSDVATAFIRNSTFQSNHADFLDNNVAATVYLLNFNLIQGAVNNGTVISDGTNNIIDLTGNSPTLLSRK